MYSSAYVFIHYLNTHLGKKKNLNRDSGKVPKPYSA